MIDHYDWAGGREAMLRFGPDTGPVVVAAMPLLEEWNRTRTFAVTLLRALAECGVASVLPDVPGHGESLLAIADQTVPRLAEALGDASDSLNAQGRPTYALGIRSGALLDRCGPYRGRWHFSPVAGVDMLRDLHRVWLTSERFAADRSLDAMMSGDKRVAIAGTDLSADFLSSLTVAEPFDEPGVARRIVRLTSDPRPADRRVEGVPLWRRAEPGNDPALAAVLADDIAAWIKTCAG
ncbi:hypothetical protein [Sphingomonas sp.]|uniref:hypothetical protein n=1 Tax=Sphingomonas sp. TaxID=28214 RepID=UPI0035BC92F9